MDVVLPLIFMCSQASWAVLTWWSWALADARLCWVNYADWL